MPLPNIPPKSRLLCSPMYFLSLCVFWTFTFLYELTSNFALEQIYSFGGVFCIGVFLLLGWVWVITQACTESCTFWVVVFLLIISLQHFPALRILNRLIANCFLPWCPARVYSQRHLVGHWGKQDAGRDGPLV